VNVAPDGAMQGTDRPAAAAGQAPAPASATFLSSSPPAAPSPLAPASSPDTGRASEAGADKGEKKSLLGVLRHRHYRMVWIGAFISSVGSWMETTGVQWQMAKLTLGAEWIAAGRPPAAIMMGYLVAAQLLPTLFFGIAGGVLADRVNRKKLLLVTQALLMLVAAALTAASALDAASPTFLIVIAAVNGLTMAFNVPAWQVLTPRLVPREELTRAITLNGMQFNLARVVGPALAGLLMVSVGLGGLLRIKGWIGSALAPLVGDGTARAMMFMLDARLPRFDEHDAGIVAPTILFAINTLSFLAVILAVWRTPDAPAPSSAGVSPLSQVKEAAAFVFRRRGPAMVFLALVVFSILAAPMVRMLPIFVSEVYHAQEDEYGILLAFMGLGAVVGGLALKLVPPWYPKHHFIPLSILLSGVAVTAFSIVTSTTLAAIAIFFAGAFWLWSFNSAMSAMQLLVEDKMRGRVLAVCNTAVFGASPAGVLLAGYISSIVASRAPGGGDIGFGVQVGVGALSLVLVLCGVAMLIWRTPEIDGISPGDASYDRRPGLWRGVTAPAHRPGGRERPR